MPENTETFDRDQLAACQQDVRHVGKTPIVIVPNHYKVANLEGLLAAPMRKRGTTTLRDAGSFVTMVNDHKDDSTRLFYVDSPAPGFTAVFNDHGNQPGWGDHRARYEPIFSQEWKAWIGVDAKKMSQVEMAQFIENNLDDVVEPVGAELLEICRTLEAKKQVNFASSIRLSDGSHQFTYEEDVQGSAQKGQLKVPEIFVIGVPVFINGEKWKVQVRLRFRIDGGKLSMWLEVVRPHKTLEAAVKDILKQVSDGTGLMPLHGTQDTRITSS